MLKGKKNYWYHYYYYYYYDLCFLFFLSLFSFSLLPSYFPFFLVCLYPFSSFSSLLLFSPFLLPSLLLPYPSLSFPVCLYSFPSLFSFSLPSSSLLLPYPSLSFSSHSLFLSVHLLTLLYKTWNCYYYDLSFLFSFPLFPPILSFISTSSKPTL